MDETNQPVCQCGKPMTFVGWGHGWTCNHKDKKMTPEQERLVKAEQTATFLLSELQEIHKHTKNIALEELILPLIGQTRTTAQLLQRLNSCTK
jgi:hypothetical protein